MITVERQNKYSKQLMVKPTSISSAFGIGMSQSRFLSLEHLVPWLKADYTIHELINDFWGLDTKSRLISVTKDIDDKSWRGLVAEWDSFTEQSGQFRLNKNLVKSLLNLSLGESPKQTDKFELKNLTELEFALFENFFVELENFWRDYWRVSEPNSHGTFDFLIWAIELDNQEIGSIAIGVPPGLSPKSILTKKTLDRYEFRNIAKDFEVWVPIDLTVGKTKLSISEVRNLEAGDLLVFDDSNNSYCFWQKDDLNSMVINIQLPEEHELLGRTKESVYYNDLEMDNMSETANTNVQDDLLTDLPVDLIAQFKSVQMPLQKIMELEAGGVLPLGLLIDSPLTLMAPGNKPIAQGELVIVGNQFGLKISKTSFKAGPQDYPKAQLSHRPNVDPALLEQAVASAAQERSAPPALTGEEDFEPAHNMTQAMHDDSMGDFGQDFDEDDDQLNQELEDVGIDPQELDDLEDMY